MTNCKIDKMEFPACNGKKIEVEFIDESVTSDGGAVLLREMDRQLNLSSLIGGVIPEYREPIRVEHPIESMIKQRIIGLALGYEDLNDHNDLRNDPAIQTAMDRTTPLASPPTLCRLENTATMATCLAMGEIIVEQFIASFDTPPTQLILDADPTDDQTHGNQEGKHYNGYYKHNCFLPLHIFCGSQLLVSYLRPSNIDGAKHVLAILSLLVKRFRQVWPDVKIIFRGDGGMCRDKILNWCERKNIYYIVGIAKNTILVSEAKPLIARAEKEYEQMQEKIRLFDQFYYKAKKWKHKRKIIVKAEHGEKGQNPRFITTNIDFPEDEVPQVFYDKWYCARGNMENKIKELKLDVKSGRTSCTDWWANQFRLLLAGFAYILLDSLRRMALKKTELANATVGTIRLKLLKVGAIIRRNTRRIRFLLSENFVKKSLFYKTATFFNSG